MTPLQDAANRRVGRWGEMGGYWGINRTMAEIHALLDTGCVFPDGGGDIFDRLANASTMQLFNRCAQAMLAWRRMHEQRGAYYLGGHRPVRGRFALRADGRYVQIHNPEGFIAAKLGGVRQLYHFVTGDVTRPIRTPLHEGTITRETCESCHAPERDRGVKDWGTLKPDTTLLDATAGEKERIGKLFVLKGAEHVEFDEHRTLRDLLALGKAYGRHLVDDLGRDLDGFIGPGRTQRLELE